MIMVNSEDDVIFTFSENRKNGIFERFKNIIIFEILLVTKSEFEVFKDTTMQKMVEFYVFLVT